MKSSVLSLVMLSAALGTNGQYYECTITKALGCYEDFVPKGHRVLPSQTGTSDAANMSPGVCLANVAQSIVDSGDVLVGLEYGDECFYQMGNKISSSAVKKPDSDCEKPCAGDSSETCGGDYRIQVSQANCTIAPPAPPYPPGPLPSEGPCDILREAGNPCVAAHSTTRALYQAYDGPLYNITRTTAVGKSNLTEWKSIGLLKTGGFANASAAEEFCAGADTCVISNVYDQSPMGNHLGQRHKLVDALTHKLTVGPDRTPVYGMWFDPGYGYHVDNTTGIATGNDPESMYAVMSGYRYNAGCCFDYGNSETSDKDDGCGAMEAIYFGNANWHGNTGAGQGPWVGADLEQGMYYGGGDQTKVNNDNKPLPYAFVSLSLKGLTDGFTLKGGDATKGTLDTMYNGSRPNVTIADSCSVMGGQYQPMRKQGAIILATGGDESNSAMGNFYEGYMTTGYASDETDAKIQENIIAVGYRTL